MAVNDLVFIVRSSDYVVLDRRANRTNPPPFPTGYILPAGQQLVYGNSDTDLNVVPNSWVWNQDTPATFQERPAAPEPTGDVAGAIDALQSAFDAQIAALRVSIGL